VRRQSRNRIVRESRSRIVRESRSRIVRESDNSTCVRLAGLTAVLADLTIVLMSLVAQRFDRVEAGGFARRVVAKEDSHCG
jgi:hypothetical protein